MEQLLRAPSTGGPGGGGGRRGDDRPPCAQPTQDPPGAPAGRIGKNPFFYIKKTSPVVFFLGGGGLGVFWVCLYICSEERGVLGFFQFQEYI